jgi:hypothetical protein
VHERSEIAHKRADETIVEQFVGHASSAVVLNCAKTSLVGTGEQSLRTSTAFGTAASAGRSGLPAIDCLRWRGSTAIRVRSSAGTQR